MNATWSVSDVYKSFIGKNCEKVKLLKLCLWEHLETECLCQISIKKSDSYNGNWTNRVYHYNQDIVEYASEEFLTLALDNKKGAVEEINKGRDIFEKRVRRI